MYKRDSVPSSPTEEDASQLLLRKINVLKKALFKDREENQKDIEELENTKKKISVLELILSEKDNQIYLSNQKREELESILEKLHQKSQKNDSPTPVQGTKVRVAELEEKNKQLIDEYQCIKLQNLETKNKFNALTLQNKEIQKQIALKDEHLKTVITGMETTLKDLTGQQELVERELNTLKNLYSNLSDAQNKLKNEITELASKKKELETETESLISELQTKQSQVTKLNERLLKQSEKEAVLSSKLMQYKNELVEAESYFQKHDVVKINNIMNQSALLVLKRDHTGHYVIEIEERKNKTLYELNDIESVAVHPHTDKRFYIRVVGANPIEFETPCAEAVVSKINFFMSKAREDQGL
jgi:chromosome segregation ATPase